MSYYIEESKYQMVGGGLARHPHPIVLSVSEQIPANTHPKGIRVDQVVGLLPPTVENGKVLCCDELGLAQPQ